MLRLAADPLLTAAKLLLMLMGGIILFAFVMVIIAVGAVVSVERADVLAQMADRNIPASYFWLVVAAMAMVITILAGALQFLRLLYQIITTVDQGDPFIPANAKRLELMGWITVAIHGGLAIIWLVAVQLEVHSEEVGTTVDASLSGLFLALTLFVLARIFRHGTTLRAEVEGTI